MKRAALLMILCLLKINWLISQTTTILGPAGSERYGEKVIVLPNGNFVVIDSYYDEGPISNVGAVYLYNGLTKQLISTLKGDQANDLIGFDGILVLPNGNYVVKSPIWRIFGGDGFGAFTWCDANLGINGVVSATNSLVGNAFNSKIGGKIFALPNSNYVICSPNWNAGKGAATLCDGNTGRFGIISETTSLIGANADAIGRDGITILADGNYIVNSSGYEFNKGAVTWCSGTAGNKSTVSATNSLIGRSFDDFVGRNTYALPNGNYVVSVPDWDLNGGSANIGAVVLCRGIAIGIVNNTNAIIGTFEHYGLGSTTGESITVLTNSNFVINSRGLKSLIGGVFKQEFGGVTWQSGELNSGTNISMGNIISASNSILGDKELDRVGAKTIALPNGNYVISSPEWSSPTAQKVGAITWADGTMASSFIVGASNSLIGSTAFDYVGSNDFLLSLNTDGITILPNNNFVVKSINWDNGAFNNAGAVTYCSGIAPTTGTINSTNSLIGNKTNEKVGEVIKVLTNGNYVVGTPKFIDTDTFGDYRSGAVTYCNGTTGTTGIVSKNNSLTGTFYPFGNTSFGKDIVALTNGNYVALSNMTSGNGTAGGATLCQADGSTTGIANLSNTITGGIGQTTIGYSLEALTNGNYLVHHPNFTEAGTQVGAVTLLNGSIATNGQFTSCNSVVGNTFFSIVEGDKNIKYNYTFDYLLAGSKFNSNNRLFIYEGPTAITTANSNLARTENSIGSQPFSFVQSCNLIASVVPNGLNPIQGPITAKVWIEEDQPDNYLKRHYEITPTNNQNTVSAKITLYFTQAEFDDYNAINTDKLPIDPNDNIGKGRFIIEKRGGTSNNNTGLPDTYSGSITTIDPLDTDIVWNGPENRWEVSFNTTGFSGFFAKAANNPLPLNWISISAKLNNNNQAIIKWKVAESGISMYEIQKSIGDKYWNTIGQIESKGNGENEYFLEENEISSGIIYYRIKQKGLDGSSSYSKIISLNIEEYMEVSISPNPVVNLLTIKMSKITNGKAQFNLLATNGKIVKKQTLLERNSVIDLSDLSTGIYFLQVKNGEKIIHQKTNNTKMKKKLYFLIILFATTGSLSAQVGVNATNTPPNPKAILDVSSTDKGMLIPRMTTAQKNALPTPVPVGMMVYDISLNNFSYFNGSIWINVSGPSGSPWTVSDPNSYYNRTGNVGIGTTNPQEKLHVGGGIRAQSLAGVGTRAVEVDANGTLSATAASMGFKNMVSFQPGTTLWTVPAGVTKIFVEAWGGGGGGGIYTFSNGLLYGAGAGSGAYGYNYANVNPGQNLIVIVGYGGEGTSSTEGMGGGLSEIPGIVEAQGGSQIGGFESYSNAGVSGESGHQLELSYGNASAANYNLILKLGDGGTAYKGGPGGKGGWFVAQNSNTPIFNIPNDFKSRGGYPGGGGGCGNPYISTKGGDGGSGLIVIYY
jgi:hypothetical protein